MNWEMQCASREMLQLRQGSDKKGLHDWDENSYSYYILLFIFVYSLRFDSFEIYLWAACHAFSLDKKGLHDWDENLYSYYILLFIFVYSLRFDSFEIYLWAACHAFSLNHWGNSIRPPGPCPNVGARCTLEMKCSFLSITSWIWTEAAKRLFSHLLKYDMIYFVLTKSPWFYCYRHICYFDGRCQIAKSNRLKLYFSFWVLQLIRHCHKVLLHCYTK